MRTFSVVAILACIVLFAAGLSAGCTGTGTTSPTATPTQSASPAETQAPSTAAATLVPTETQAPAAAAISVNESWNGKTLTIPVGQEVIIRLDENPTTGYSWNATIPKGLTLMNDTYVASNVTVDSNATDANATLVGTGGYREWILSPDYIDTYSFKAVYFQPWETAKPTDDTFTLVIAVTKA